MDPRCPMCAVPVPMVFTGRVVHPGATVDWWSCPAGHGIGREVSVVPVVKK